jgi:inner membrane transporter RhtA
VRRSAAYAPAVPPWGLAVAAMLSVQLGSAPSVDVISTVGPAGTAWLRITVGAVVFLALARPPLREVHRHDVPTLLGLGVATGLQTMAFLAAIERIPLGTCVAIEFLGPLTVAGVCSRSARALVWPGLAALGVVLVTVAAATAAVAGVPQAGGHLTPAVLAAGAGSRSCFPSCRTRASCSPCAT